ncbi:hypothetical protein BDR22DRAFT_890804 [Usnea florida]
MKLIYCLLPLVSSALANVVIKCPCYQQDCSKNGPSCACENQNIVNKYFCCDANVYPPTGDMGLKDCSSEKPHPLALTDARSTVSVASTIGNYSTSFNTSTVSKYTSTIFYTRNSSTSALPLTTVTVSSNNGSSTSSVPVSVLTAVETTSIPPSTLVRVTTTTTSSVSASVSTAVETTTVTPSTSVTTTSTSIVATSTKSVPSGTDTTHGCDQDTDCQAGFFCDHDNECPAGMQNIIGVKCTGTCTRQSN